MPATTIEGRSSRDRPRASIWLAPGVILVTLVVLTGCSSKHFLMPTPSLYLRETSPAFTAVPASLQTNEIDVLYVTDRAPEHDSGGKLTYGYRRSLSLAYGRCLVSIGNLLTWDELRTESLRRERPRPLELVQREVHELGRFPDTPMAVTTNAEGLLYEPSARSGLLAAQSGLQQEIRRRLALTPRKDVVVFVHGFNNNFPWATSLTAQLWHFLQREGVPIAYTWPAGRGGLLRGYTYDRESGEFTVFHLKQFLRTLLGCPDIERIHLLAHSRGTDVLTTALRELIIEQRGPQRATAHLPRVANVILVAPDLDVQVASQRLSAEHIELAVDRVSIYVCSEDRAITFANWFFEGVRRLGILRESDFTEDHKVALRQYRNVEFIDARVKAGFLSHGYFYSNPAVSSDLLLLLRENCSARDHDCRPLEGNGDPFWRLSEDYPNPVRTKEP